MNRPARVAVFVSGGGTNLQALLDHFNGNASSIARVALVVASRAGIGAIERARRAGVDARVLPPIQEGDDAATGLLQLLRSCGIDLIVLAGYLRLVPEAVVQEYEGRMLNIHPALLPAFGGPGMYGLRVHRAVLASGARVSGATVHLVGARYDEGPILAQWPVPVFPSDTPEELAARVLPVEHLILPAAVESLVAGEAAPAEPAGSFALAAASLPPESQVAAFVKTGVFCGETTPREPPA